MRNATNLLAIVTISLLAVPALADPAAPAEPEPPASEVQASTGPIRTTHKGLFNGGLRTWSADGDSRTLAGIELGGNPSNHFAIAAELMTNIEGDPMEATAARIGARAYLLPGAFSPYAAGRLGALFGSDDIYGIWTVTAGMELAVEPSGLLFDLGVGKVGAFGEQGTLTELSVSVGKRY